ncbi:MAG: ABC transporter ATP-binding protein [Bacteroidetes bacterium]|nr:ABC transporter ATP-binding protein [Bacteroidota bacterium]MCH8525031.1 ABC transporter ATP-binding protein [Balneolales bacterium]
MIKLTVAELGKHFGFRWIFRDVSIAQEGGVLGIAGLNGSGKSTLMRCLASLNAPDRGRVTWYDDAIELKRSMLRDVSGYAAPYVQLYGELTCAENLDFILTSRGLENNSERITSFMQRAGISAKQHALYKSLSSGQQQRCKLIASMIHKPRILFLDEPGTNLDTPGIQFIRELVDERRTADFTVIASNDSRELDLCDSVFTILTN